MKCDSDTCKLKGKAATAKTFCIKCPHFSIYQNIMLLGSQTHLEKHISFCTEKASKECKEHFGLEIPLKFLKKFYKFNKDFIHKIPTKENSHGKHPKSTTSCSHHIIAYQCSFQIKTA
jgi:hypothetical protein